MNKTLKSIFDRGYANIGQHISVQAARGLMRKSYVYRVRDDSTGYSFSAKGVLSGQIRLSHKGNTAVAC